MSSVVELEEYSAADVEMTPKTAERITRIAGAAVTLTPSQQPGKWSIRATSWVGTIAVGDRHILIRPKVNAANLFHMLEAGGKATVMRPEIFEYERSRDLLPAFATFYASVLERSLARGVPREYREFDDRLVALRGRVDTKEQLRSGGLPIPVACRFDEHTADVQVNRIVRGAAEVLLRLPGVSVATRQTLMRLAAQLEAVSAVGASDLSNDTTFSRLSSHMENADRLARLVLAGSGITNRAGGEGASAFLVNMNAVFETYLEHRLRRALRGRLVVSGQHGAQLDRVGHVRIRPDLLFSRARRPVYVGDAKYKLTASGFGRESDYYQLLAYTTALDLPEGVLVYCHEDGPAPPRDVDVLNSSKRLNTWRIPLAGSPSELDAAVEELGCWILDRASQAEALDDPGRSRVSEVVAGPRASRRCG